MKVVSCIPEQTETFEEKLAWIDRTLQRTRADLLVLPQEYFGGIQKQLFNTDEPLVYEEVTVVDAVSRLASKHDAGIIVGALVHDRVLNQNRERAYVIDPSSGVVGYFDKIMLPAYDHIEAKGITRVSPETDLENRAKAVEVKGLRVSVLFCWEVYSNYIWHAITRAQPDAVVSMIKFGIKGWPRKGKDPETGQSLVLGFGFGDDGGWLERLRMGARFDVAAPVICSTNSWRLPMRSWPLAGTIYPFDYIEDSLWHPQKGARGTPPEIVIEDEIDPLFWRFVRSNKYRFHQATGKWPDGEVRKYTMMWKIKRMERKLFGPRPSPVQITEKHTGCTKQQELFCA